MTAAIAQPVDGALKTGEQALGDLRMDVVTFEEEERRLRSDRTRRL
jgi:hypothetical protein